MAYISTLDSFRILGIDEKTNERVIVSTQQLMQNLNLSLPKEYSPFTETRFPGALNRLARQLVIGDTYLKIAERDKAAQPVSLQYLKEFKVFDDYFMLNQLRIRQIKWPPIEVYSPKDIGLFTYDDFFGNERGLERALYTPKGVRDILMLRIILDATDRFRISYQPSPSHPGSSYPKTSGPSKPGSPKP